MAHPALIKAAVVLATDKRTWEAVGVVIAAVLTPFILTVIAVSSRRDAACQPAGGVRSICHRDANLLWSPGRRDRRGGG